MENWKTRTKLVHAGSNRSQFGELSEALYLTQGFVYENAEAARDRFIETGEDEFIYARYGNPTVRMFEERMAALEGAEDGFAAASGMAAVSGTLFSMLKSGDHIVSGKALFGSILFLMTEVLPRWGIEVTLVDGTDLGAWEKAKRKDTKVVFMESVSNPTLDVTDVAGVSKLAKAVGATVVVDNVFATPVFQNSLELGADVVIYSTTKHIDGQGRCLGGIVLGSKKFIREVYEPFNKHTGPALSPFNAWVMLKGLETVALRCEAQACTAEKIVWALKDHDAIERVLYPLDPAHPQFDVAKHQMRRGGTVVSFELNGGREAAFKFLNALEIIKISNNLGDAKSLATHPVTTTHKSLTDQERAEAGIREGLVRLSVGLEDADDLVAEVEKALTASQA